jgi:hypothetical protein
MSFENITDAEELQQICWGEHLLYDTVETNIIGTSRWHVEVETVFKRLTDGQLFVMFWRKGATESQDHDYPDLAMEAEAYIKTITKYRPKT